MKVMRIVGVVWFSISIAFLLFMIICSFILRYEATTNIDICIFYTLMFITQVYGLLYFLLSGERKEK